MDEVEAITNKNILKFDPELINKIIDSFEELKHKYLGLGFIPEHQIKETPKSIKTFVAASLFKAKAVVEVDGKKAIELVDHTDSDNISEE